VIDLNALRAYCGSKRGAVEDFPFGEGALVFKVTGKMFALLHLEGVEGSPPSINLKCDPALAEILRATYPAVQPGYHMSKRHWNTVTVDGSISDEEIYEMVDNSYALVVRGLKKAERDKLEAQGHHG
jgi:predicted DNA-binding protein (MmcQ/YjbR family)